MGASSSKSVAPKDPKKQSPSKYKWPTSVYDEARDMAAASFLVYVFGIILETARRHKEAFKGIEVERSSGRVFRRTNIIDRNLPRTFTPADVIALIQENLPRLQKEFPGYFKDPRRTLRSLEMMQKRIDASGIKGKPLTLEEYDDRHQHKGPVYAIAVDRINRRVTLAFRGTDNALAFHTNWRANAKIIKTNAAFPPCLKGKLPVEGVQLHGGFYDYLFGRKSGTSSKAKTRFEEMYDALRPILKANPGYKLYVTGHSLGGALAIVAALYFASDQSSQLPKPVTCVSFGAPRVGDVHFMRAVRQLEESDRLRYLRVVNDNDAITSVPVWQYHHAGIQLRLFRNERQPDISYPKQGSLPNKLSLTLGNSLFNNINAQYDHQDYRERIEAHKKVLKQRSLNELYADKVLTGFSGAGLTTECVYKCSQKPKFY